MKSKRGAFFFTCVLTVLTFMSGCTGLSVKNEGETGAHLEFRAYAKSGTVRIESRGETVLENRIKGEWLKVAPDDWLETDRPFTLTVERDSRRTDDDVFCMIVFSGHTIDEKQIVGSETSVTCRYDTWRDAVRGPRMED